MPCISAMIIPAFTDDDISWACKLLDLPPDAFADREGHDHGRDILCLTSPADIAACPGSGKTTLLVAKLAILARHWTERHRGICVLSHTNVARNEIADRLSGTGAAEALLGYPHFVGTIQAFVDEYLALPWLRSHGYLLQAIDDDRCEQHRRTLMLRAEFRTLLYAVRGKENANERINVVRGWRLGSSQCELVKDDGQPMFGPDAPSTAQLAHLGLQCAQDGYFRFCEMFMWAQDLLQKAPGVVPMIRRRFPLVFVDEVQDNSQEQAALLHKVFVEGEDSVMRQRFGDANQAIFAGDDAPTSDIFPAVAIQRIIANSHRFGQSIASFADSFAVEPQDLIGHGPSDGRIKTDTNGQHTVFLFDADAVTRVMPEYGDHLLSVFSESELRIGTFTAVGAVHRPSEDKLVVGSYWPHYNYELTAADPRPANLVDSLVAGRTKALASNNAHPAAEALAGSLLRALRLEEPNSDLPIRRRQHRQIVDLLKPFPEAADAYRELVQEVVVRLGEPELATWEDRYRRKIELIVQTVIGRSVRTEAVQVFLSWPPTFDVNGATPSRTNRKDNFYRYPQNTPRLDIRLGSIHSVKGETHTATLVLDVDYHGSQWKALKPWLLGVKRGRGREGVRNQKRLREHYVAMTRPTHLLCVAMRLDHTTPEDVGKLKERGWRVRHVRQQDASWL